MTDNSACNQPLQAIGKEYMSFQLRGHIYGTLFIVLGGGKLDYCEINIIPEVIVTLLEDFFVCLLASFLLISAILSHARALCCDNICSADKHFFLK